MRVMLIIPTYEYKYGYPWYMSNSDFPVGFAYLASALRNAGHKVIGLNPNNDASYGSAYEMLYERTRQSLQENQPELIGLGGLCTDFKFLKDAIQIIRTLAPNVPIVCGGGIINNDAKFIFQTLKPDFCIVGEGEEVLVELVKILESDRQDYEEISNLGYWKEDIPKFTRQNFNYINIDKRCFPDYEPFGIREMLDEYSMATRPLYRYTRPNSRPMTIVAARGCPFNCTFCVHQRGPRYRARSVENIIQEIAFLYQRYHFNVLIILDELFAVNKSRLREFCSALIQARETQSWDFDWIFQAHVSASFDREVLKMAKKAGCYCFSYGLESASPKTLASMNKKTKPSQILEAIEIAHAVGVGFSGNFIFGDVAETTETVTETMNFFSRYCLDDHIYLTAIQPYPGSKLFEFCMKRDVIHDKLKFYEHIDEGVINMTSIPDWLWTRWMYRLLFLGNLFPWVKSVNAFRCIKELETAHSPMVFNSGKLIWKVWAKCPHCGKEVYYREPLKIAIARQTAPPFVSLRHRIFILLKHIIAKGKKAVLSFVTSRIRLFKLLKPLMVNGKQVSPSFVTGCPHCHRRFGINIPIMDFENQFEHNNKTSGA